MAGNGPAPKEKRSRSRDQLTRDIVKADGKIGGFDLPEDVLPPIKIEGEVQLTPDGEIMREEWNKATVRWWRRWRESPQAIKMMTGPDWDFLLDTALLHHQMWESGGKNSERAAEIRLRAAKFGATPEDRLRIKLEVEVPNGEEFAVGKAGNVASMDSQRRRRIAGGA